MVGSTENVGARRESECDRERGLGYSWAMRQLGLALMVVLAGVAAGCGGPPRLPQYPGGSSLAAGAEAFGVPYRHWIACRLEGRPLALELRPTPGRADRVSWHWQWLEPPAEGPAEASGTTVERHGLGEVRVGGLALEWSRGSEDFGWVYWPTAGPQFEVYSRPFVDTAACRRPSGGSWLRRSMFEPD